MRYKSLLCLAVAASLMGVFAAESPGVDGPEQAAAPDAAPKTETRIYDIRDLILVVDDYPSDATLVPPTEICDPNKPTPHACGAYMRLEKTRFERVDDVIKLIEEIIASDSWKESGGQIGSIKELCGELIVTQTPENLTAIEKFLSQRRQTRGPMVRVRADWVLLAPGQVEGLIKNGRDDKSALPEISRDALDKTAVHAVHFAAALSCFNCQTVNLGSGRAKSTIVSRTAELGDHVGLYQTNREIVQYGLSLQATPTLSGDFAILDLKCELSEPQETPEEAPTTQPSDDKDKLSDHLNTVVQHFHTTVRLPLNKPVLVQGSTANPTIRQQQEELWYLIVEVDAGK